MNALDYLIRFEYDSLNLYKILGSETNDPELKELYILLTDTRQRHLDALGTLNESIRGEDVTSRFVERADHVTNGYREVLLTRDMMKEMRNDRDAFEHVSRAEHEMINMCEGMARAEESEKVRALLNWFVEDEKRYLEEIEGIYEFVEAPHSYLEWGEFSNLHTL